ncbi:MAG TPA: hypothetical protein VFA47_10905 [Candidatus Manganitrophaceae bacterium]|nr:hypothetical protein [Candidatus Manganitrophaceae bacterium]
MVAPKTREDFIYFSDAAADGKVEMFREPESILEDRQSGSCAGVLRPGIKVPKTKGPNTLNPDENALYQKMMKENISPREIERVIGKELDPKNVGYFSVYASECKSNPQSAEKIRSLYGDKNGEIKRLRITFVDSEWWQIIPHKLMAFRKRGLYCSSEPVDGKLIATRDTSMDGPEENEGGPNRPFRRKLKRFPCVPDECDVYQKGYCRLSGLLNFMIVGVPGTDIWKLPTSSWHSVRGIMEKILRFKKALSKMGGSLVGVPFWLFKYESEVAGWDSNKRSKVRLKQWLFGIDCPELPLSDLLVKQAGYKINEATPSPAPNDSPRDRETGVPAVLPMSESVDQTEKKENPILSNVETIKTVLPEIKVEIPAPMMSDHSGTAALFPANQTTEEMERLRVKIQSEVEPRGPVPMEFINIQTVRMRKTRMSELTLEELKQIERAIGEFRSSPWERCASCGGLLDPEVKEYSTKHFHKGLCRDCQKKEKGASNLPPQLSVVRKTAGQVQGAGF